MWSLDTALCVWGPKDRFYSPPWVLVLGTGERLKGAVRVAQVYDDPVLAGEGDVSLGEEWGAFAEPWNLYTVRRAHLQSCRGEVHPRVVAEVTQRARQPPPNPDEASLLFRFRELEIEAGYAVSSRAVEALLHPPLVFGVLEDVKAALEAVVGGAVTLPARLGEGLLDTAAALISAQLPVQAGVLYADTDDAMPSEGRIFMTSDGKLASFRPVTVRLARVDFSDGELSVDGELPSEERLVLDDADVSGHWVFPDRSTVRADRFHVDPTSGDFLAVFRVAEEPEGEFRLLVLSED